MISERWMWNASLWLQREEHGLCCKEGSSIPWTDMAGRAKPTGDVWTGMHSFPLSYFQFSCMNMWCFEFSSTYENIHCSVFALIEIVQEELSLTRMATLSPPTTSTIIRQMMLRWEFPRLLREWNSELKKKLHQYQRFISSHCERFLQRGMMKWLLFYQLSPQYAPPCIARDESDCPHFQRAETEEVHFDGEWAKTLQANNSFWDHTMMFTSFH